MTGVSTTTVYSSILPVEERPKPTTLQSFDSDCNHTSNVIDNEGCHHMKKASTRYICIILNDCMCSYLFSRPPVFRETALLPTFFPKAIAMKPVLSRSVRLWNGVGISFNSFWGSSQIDKHISLTNSKHDFTLDSRVASIGWYTGA